MAPKARLGVARLAPLGSEEARADRHGPRLWGHTHWDTVSAARGTHLVLGACSDAVQTRCLCTEGICGCRAEFCTRTQGRCSFSALPGTQPTSPPWSGPPRAPGRCRPLVIYWQAPAKCWRCPAGFHQSAWLLSRSLTARYQVSASDAKWIRMDNLAGTLFLATACVRTPNKTQADCSGIYGDQQGLRRAERAP